MIKVLKRLSIIAQNISDVDVKHNTPEGLFTRKASDIVDDLLKDSSNNVTKAIQRINFYISRSGENLSNKTEILKAKEILENKKR